MKRGQQVLHLGGWMAGAQRSLQGLNPLFELAQILAIVWVASVRRLKQRQARWAGQRTQFFQGIVTQCVHAHRLQKLTGCLDPRGFAYPLQPSSQLALLSSVR
jgi:hypothetical protein